MSDINVTVQDEIVEIDVIDTPVYVDVINSPGAAGPAGPGVAVGGTAGQILAKASATNYDTEWINNYAKYLATNVRNQTGSTIAAFRVVYISGATGNKPLVSLADADTEATSSKTYGVTAVSIANNGTGDVVTAGELSGIDTSAFNEGDSLWLSSTAGQVQTTPPAEPAHAVFIGTVVRSHPTLGVIDVAIQNGYELTELHGVEITSAANNDGLFYNGSLWVNKSIATVLGYTPEQPLTFSSPLSRVGNVVSIPQATGSVNGFLSSTDWTTFNSKQAAIGYTPANAATTLTINGVTFDLSTSRTWNISAGISGSGASGQVTYWTGASAVSGSNNLFWDNTNARLGIGTASPTSAIDAIGANFKFGRGGNVDFDVQNTSANSYLRLNAGTGVVSISSLNTNDIGFNVNSNRVITLKATSNVLLGTTTDNGARLQVSGTSTFSGKLTISTGGIEITGSTLLNTSISTNSVSASYNASFQNARENFYGGGNTLLTSLSTYVFWSGRNFVPTSGNATFAAFYVDGTINQTGGANGITRGLYVNPTLTSAADFRAIETARGNIVFANLPTSSAGLPSGALWNNGGVINIV